jgi:carboxylesterase type B
MHRYQKGSAHISEIIAGVTAQDGLLTFTELATPGTVPNTTANMTSTLESYFGYDGEAQALYDLYVKDEKVDETNPKAMAMAFLAMNSDVCIVCPTTELLDDIGSKNKDVSSSWFYHFIHNPLPGLAGLCLHSGELNTVFGYVINPLRAAIFPAPDPSLSAEVIERITNFASKKSPTASEAVDWGEYSSSRRNGLQFETPKTSVFQQLQADKCKQWARSSSAPPDSKSLSPRDYFCWYSMIPNPNPAKRDDAKKMSGISKGVIIGIAIGAVAFAGLAALLLTRSHKQGESDLAIRLQLEKGSNDL